MPFSFVDVTKANVNFNKVLEGRQSQILVTKIDRIKSHLWTYQQAMEGRTAMLREAVSKVNEKILASAQETKRDRIWCEVCGSDEYIVIERARWRRRQGDGCWDVDYTCTNCDSVYGHVVKAVDVTASLLASMTTTTDRP